MRLRCECELQEAFMTTAVAAGRGIVTPQGVILDLEAAGVGFRGLARFIDVVIAAFLIVAVVQFIEITGAVGGATFSLVLQIIFSFLVLFMYPVVAETYFRGRTIGKWVTGLRVVTLEAGPVGFREAFIRSLFQLVDFILTYGGLALICGMFTKRSQRLGDLAAGTFVIRDPRVISHVPAVAFTPPMGTEIIVANMNVMKLRPKQERVIRSFLLRVGELSGPARVDLGTRLSAVTSEHLGHPGTYGLPPETYLVAVLAAAQLRDGGLAQLTIT